MSTDAPDPVVHKMPWRQLTILILVRLGEPVAYASVFPYLPAMILSFPGVKPVDIGFWTGTAAAIFSLAECSTAIAWGALSDRLGRKPVLLMGLLSTMITSLLWGFCRSLPLALFIRALSGAGNGNVGIVRTMVAELCPWKELQPRAFSIMPVVYTIGSIIGPMLGGALANPLERPTDDRADGPFLWRFPYALPNIVIAGFFLGGILIGIFFLEETLESKKGRRDWGVRIGQKLVNYWHVSLNWCKQIRMGEPQYTRLATTSADDPKEDIETSDWCSRDLPSLSEKPSKLSYRSVLTKQTVLVLTSFTLLATHTAGFDQILPVLLHHPRNGGTASDHVDFPAHFNRGFGLDTSKIGLMFSINGTVAIIVQFALFPAATRFFGTLNLLRLILVSQPIFYIASPYMALIQDPVFAEVAFVSLWTLRSAFVIMAFPCSIILVTNSAASLQVLGIVNGIATATNAIGRAFGPVLSGWLFTWGIHNNLILAPFMFLAILSMLNLVPLLWAVEGEGFCDDVEVELEAYEGQMTEVRICGDQNMIRLETCHADCKR